MISAAEEEYILTRAYVPEHIVSLMALISGGEPFLLHDCLCLAKENWVILVGYPLAGQSASEDLQRIVADVLKTFRPEHLWFIAPEVPPALAAGCHERESDSYYTLELEGFTPPADLQRSIRRASRELTVERHRRIENAHEELIAEFVTRERPNQKIERLFRSMAAYTVGSSTAMVLSARSKEARLSAFYVLDHGAKNFVTYVVGCHSKKHYVPGASDVLFAEMVAVARERGKRYIHLGLGVNEGIRRFKEKWGGIPSLKYEFCGYRRKPPGMVLSLASRAWS